MLLFLLIAGNEARAACLNPPVIGCTAAQGCSPAVEDILELVSGRITINYHDQCSGEDSTRVYARKGSSNPFAQIKSDPPNSGGWRTATHADLEANTTYCFMVQTVDGGTTRNSAYKCVTTPPARCGPPVIGWTEGGFAPFPASNATSISVQYHDQCGGALGEDWTKIFARTGASGPWQQIESDPANQSGWRTTVHDDLNPSTNYCFYAETAVDGHRQQSAVSCKSTTTPACGKPSLGWEEGGFVPFPMVTPDSIAVQYHDACGNDQATAVFGRRSNVSAWTTLHTESGPRAGWRTHTYSNLEPDTSYCFIIATTGPDDHTSYSDQRCVRTQLAFEQTVLTQAESNSVLAQFDWRDTFPVPEGSAAEPYLYYANILLEDEESVKAMRRLGMHVQHAPLFVQELSGYSDDATIVADNSGLPAGRWYFAAIPGEVYNTNRLDNIAAVERDGVANIPAIVMRRVPISAARQGSSYRLNYQYLGENGFEYNALPSKVCHMTPEGQACQKHYELTGYFGRKILTFAYDAFDFVAEATRDVFGQFSRRLEGEINLTIQFRLMNTDPLFIEKTAAGASVDTRMISGWTGQELYLADTKVRIRQGFTSFSGTTDAQGRITLPISKNNWTSVCFELDNEFVKITQHVATKDLCVKTYSNGFSSSQPVTINVKDPRANVYAQMTDTARYVQQVLGHTPAKMTVLIGDSADRLAVYGTAFAGCMGRIPNLVLSGGAELLGMLNPALFVATTSLDYLYAVDIVLPPAHEQSRGVATHEYGHTVMCSMLGALHVQTAWTQVILQSGTHATNDEASYIAEAFADFITAQVAGGTNYFQVENDIESLLINYADRDGYGLEYNYTDTSTSIAEPGYNARVRRVAAVLHDAFDGHGGAVNQPNDGRHWNYNALDFMERELGDKYYAADEPVALPGRCMPKVFARWRDQASLIAENTFLRALAQTMIANGTSLSDACALFAAHAGGTCPSYVANLTTGQGSDPCVVPSGGGGGGGSGGTGGNGDPSSPELPEHREN